MSNISDIELAGAKRAEDVLITAIRASYDTFIRRGFSQQDAFDLIKEIYKLDNRGLRYYLGGYIDFDWSSLNK